MISTAYCIWCIGWGLTGGFMTDKNVTFVKALCLGLWWPIVLGEELRKTLEKR